MSNVYLCCHPLVEDKITQLREVSTDGAHFRTLTRDIGYCLAYEATTDVSTVNRSITTPLVDAQGKSVDESIGLVPILRAGLGMVEGVLNLISRAQVWHLGFYRNEQTRQPVQYYNKLPPQPTVDRCLILDPMLATGQSAIATVDIIKRWGVRQIKFLAIISAPEGIEAMRKAHPDVDLHLGSIDQQLNQDAYIVPGLGDAGDRLYQTKI